MSSVVFNKRKQEASRLSSNKHYKRNKDNEDFKEKRKQAEKQRREAKKKEQQVKEERLAYLEEEVLRLRRKIKKLKTENDNLYDDVIELSEQVDLLNEILEELQDKQSVVSVRIKNEEIPALCGLKIKVFNDLLSQITPFMNNHTLDGTPRQRQAKSPPLFSLEQSLWMTLLWLRHYPPMVVLQSLFGSHPRTLIKYITLTLLALDDALKEEIRWPTEDEWKTHLFTMNKHIPSWMRDHIAVIDGTEITIKRPTDKEAQKKHWSGKKKQNMLNVTVICLLNGLIIYVSPPENFKNDQGHFNHLELRKLFEGKEYGILGDGGYFFNRQTDTLPIKALKPIPSPKRKKGEKKKKRGEGLTFDQKETNKQISQARVVVVENAIRQIKAWKILSGKVRHFSTTDKNAVDLKVIVRVCSGLANRKIKTSPLRKNNWESDGRQDENQDELCGILDRVSLKG